MKDQYSHRKKPVLFQTRFCSLPYPKAWNIGTENDRQSKTNLEPPTPIHPSSPRLLLGAGDCIYMLLIVMQFLVNNI